MIIEANTEYAIYPFNHKKPIKGLAIKQLKTGNWRFKISLAQDNFKCNSSTYYGYCQCRYYTSNLISIKPDKIFKNGMNI